jgi:hypothetical protein
LSELRFGERVRVEAVQRVVVNVDEARCKNETVRVDRAFSGRTRELADSDNAVAANAQGTLAQRVASAVGEASVDDEDGVGGLRSLRGSKREWRSEGKNR